MNSKISTTAGILTLQFLLLVSFLVQVLEYKAAVLIPGFCLLDMLCTLVLLIFYLWKTRGLNALLLFWFLGLLPYLVFVMPPLLRNIFDTNELMYQIRFFILISCFFISAGCLLREVYVKFIRRERKSGQ